MFSREEIEGGVSGFRGLAQAFEGRRHGAKTGVHPFPDDGGSSRITSYNVCYTKLLRFLRLFDVIADYPSSRLILRCRAGQSCEILPWCGEASDATPRCPGLSG